jgi:hypothetical protein
MIWKLHVAMKSHSSLLIMLSTFVNNHFYILILSVLLRLIVTMQAISYATTTVVVCLHLDWSCEPLLRLIKYLSFMLRLILPNSSAPRITTPSTRGFPCGGLNTNLLFLHPPQRTPSTMSHKDLSYLIKPIDH